MKTKNSSPARSIVLAALFLALAFVLPMVTGHVPQVGNMLCPMHFPILLCGFVLGGPWGLAVGFAAPLLRSALFGMPPMFPIAISMAFELAAYGAVSGWLYRRVKHTLPMTYATLAAAMVAGRLVWGAVRFVLAGLSGSSFPFSAFLGRGSLVLFLRFFVTECIVAFGLITEVELREDPACGRHEHCAECAVEDGTANVDAQKARCGQRAGRGRHEDVGGQQTGREADGQNGKRIFVFLWIALTSGVRMTNAASEKTGMETI